VAAAGSAVLPIGTTETSIFVTLVGDPVDEELETFGLQLELSSPAEAVLFDGVAVGGIANDDACRMEAEKWLQNHEKWPVDSLTIGAEELDRDELLDLLKTEIRNRATRVARQLVATKLNLASGSDPWILPDVEAADEFLVAFPPGSDPQGKDAATAAALRKQLIRYNEDFCKNEKK
jgi:hypothetical protein